MRPPRIQTKDLFKKDKSRPLSLSGRQTLPGTVNPRTLISNHFPSVLVLTLATARWRHPQVPIRGPTLSPSNTLRIRHTGLGVEKLSLRSVSRCYRWGEDVTRSALGNHQPTFQPRKQSILYRVQRVETYLVSGGDKCI